MYWFSHWHIIGLISDIFDRLNGCHYRFLLLRFLTWFFFDCHFSLIHPSGLYCRECDPPLNDDKYPEELVAGPLPFPPPFCVFLSMLPLSSVSFFIKMFDRFHPFLSTFWEMHSYPDLWLSRFPVSLLSSQKTLDLLAKSLFSINQLTNKGDIFP